MATIFDRQFCGRPCILVTIWLLSILACVFLLLGMMIDELTFATYTVNSLEYKITCSSSTFDRQPGALNEKYTSGDFTQAVLQKQAGSVWLAFGIMACLFLPFLVYGVVTDYYAGELDHRKPIECFKQCCMLQTWGFTRIAALFMLILEVFQIFLYTFSNTCGKEEFHTEMNGEIQDYSSIGGASYVMVWFSFLFLIGIFVLIVYYQYGISAELPTGEEKEAPASFNTASMVDTSGKTERAEPPQQTAPTGKAPESEYFRPKKNVTKNASYMSEGDFSGMNRQNGTGTGVDAGSDRALNMLAGDGSTMSMGTKPTGAPPVPQPRPKGPPPVPR